MSFGKVELLCIVWFLKRAARNPVWIARFQAVASGTLINKGLAGRVSGDALNTRGLRMPPLKRPKYAGFRASLLGDAPALPPLRFFNSLPLSGRCLEGAERATCRKLRFLLLQMGFDFSLRSFLLFYPLTKFLSQRAGSFSGAPNPAWIGRLRGALIQLARS